MRYPCSFSSILLLPSIPPFPIEKFESDQIFTTAEPYRINVLFTAARITPHITAKKFLEFVLQRFPNAHMSADSVCSIHIFISVITYMFAETKLPNA